MTSNFAHRTVFLGGIVGTQNESVSRYYYTVINLSGSQNDQLPTFDIEGTSNRYRMSTIHHSLKNFLSRVLFRNDDKSMSYIKN